MFYKPLLYPLLLQVALTFVVMLRMYQSRFAEMSRRHTDPQQLDERTRARQALPDSAPAADHFINLFETPVLFYTAIGLALILMLQDPVIVVLSWAYVALRAVHAFIHTGYNQVTHRFAAFMLSSIALLGIWVRLAWYILGH